MVLKLLIGRRGLKANRSIYLLSPLPKEGIKSLPMICFERVAESIDFSSCDTLMFTSKQAVVTAEAIDPKWKTIPVIAIGPATKRQVEILGGKVIYHPKKFYGEVLADDIAQFFHERHILYLRPETISFDSRGFLQKRGIVLQEQIIYKTICRQYRSSEQPPESSVIIFTSPSTIHCFLENFSWLKSYTAVVIGHSTQVHLPAECDYVVADRPLIDACIEKAMTL
jgi:uroporphyrinogen-III synthase